MTERDGPENGADRLTAVVQTAVSRIINRFLPLPAAASLGISYEDILRIEGFVRAEVDADFRTLLQKDPAAHQDVALIEDQHGPLYAVMAYRLAHELTQIPGRLSGQRGKQEYWYQGARQVSEEAKSLTGIDINPKATIGKCFVIDHGYDTVIGETTVIGDNCYILQGVIVGSRGIANNPSGARHAVIGNNVEIGACTRIFGTVKIGNNVKVDSYSVIVHDIPANTHVAVANQLQLTHPVDSPHPHCIVFGIAPMGPNQVAIMGKDLAFGSADVVDQDSQKVADFSVDIARTDESGLLLKVTCQDNGYKGPYGELGVRLMGDGQEVVLTRCRGLEEALSLGETMGGAT